MIITKKLLTIDSATIQNVLHDLTKEKQKTLHTAKSATNKLHKFIHQIWIFLRYIVDVSLAALIIWQLCFPWE